MKKKNHKIMRDYLIAKEGTSEEIYFSVRTRWTAIVKESNPSITTNELYELALKDEAALLQVLPKDGVKNAI